MKREQDNVVKIAVEFTDGSHAVAVHLDVPCACDSQ